MELTTTQKQIIDIAQNILDNGHTKIEINYDLPYVSVEHEGMDGSYFFQGEEAQNLLDEVPDWMTEEQYISYVSQGW